MAALPPDKPNPSIVPPQGRQQQSPSLSASLQFVAGPLPSPDLLRGYDQVSPGGAERIIKMAEDEGNHRRRMEEKSLDAEIESMRRSYSEARWGQMFAFAIATIFVGAGSYVAVHGQPWAGGFFGSVGIVSIVTTFIAGRKKQEPEQQPAPTKSAVKAAKRRK